MNKNLKVHVIGICGIGMSAVAILFKNLGYRVTGSDEDAYDPVYSQVKKAGIEVIKKYEENNVPQDADIVIIGMSVKLSKETNPEVKKAYQLEAEGKLKIYSYPVAIRELIFKHYENTVVVAGSFGKSSVTAIVSFLLTELELDPGYFVGAVFSDSKYCHARIGNPPWLVLEGDEYPTAHDDPRSKFLIYDPKYLILNACAHDHFNKYPTIESYLLPYQTLLEKMSHKKDSILFYNPEMPNTNQVQNYYQGNKVTFGKESSNNYFYEIIKIINGETVFKIYKNGSPLFETRTRLIGEHNLVNITGAVSFLDTMNFDVNKISDLIPRFTGIKRRLERLSPSDKPPIYESFGSSFDKTKADLKAIKTAFANLDLIVIFEPHTFALRDRLAKNWYLEMFTECKKVYIVMPPNEHAKNLENQLSMNEIVEMVNSSGTECHLLLNDSEFEEVASKLNQDKEILAIVSSGDTNNKKRIINRLFN